MDKPRSTWGFNAAGEKQKITTPILSQKKIDALDSKFLKDVYQDARDKWLKEKK